MASSKTKKDAPTPQDAAPKPAFRPSPFALVDLSGGSVSRQLRIDKPTYDRVEELRTEFKKHFATELGMHRLTLEEVLVMCLQAGAVALSADPNASRRVP